MYIHSLEYSLRILCDDLKMSTEKGNVCTSLNALQHIFDSKSTYYSSYGMDMVRLDMVSGFLRIKGFKHLIAYLRARVTTLEFPHMRLISVLIQATKDLVNHDEEDLVRMVQELTYEMANAVMNHMWSDLGQVFTTGFENDVQCVIKGLYDLCQLSSESNPKILADFFAFRRS